MINFPKNFFDGEERDGFYIESMMKSAWAAQIEVLKAIENVCEKHNIKYFAYWGTLLGAVRHGGFIPWDDDLDICMKREDYTRFLEIAPYELPQGYRVLAPSTTDLWGEAIARVTNSDSISFNQNFIDRFHGCPFCIGVDIFPYDYLPSDSTIQDTIDNMLGMIASLRLLAEATDEESRAQLKSSMDSLAESLNYTYAQGKSPSHQLLILYDDVCAAYGAPSDKYLTCYPERLKRHGDYKVPAYWFDESVDLPFECTTIKVPKYYELCLSVCYGKDFMTPRKGVAAHDYPFYNHQIDVAKENSRWEELQELIASSLSREVYDETAVSRYGQNITEDFCQKYSYFNSLKTNEVGSKIILYYVSSMDFYEQEEKTFEKIIDTLNYFQNCTDKIKLIFVACDDVTDLLMHRNVELAYEYEDLRSYYSEQDWLIYDNGAHLYDAIAVCDAFYGNQNISTGILRRMKKPIMIQNPNIQNA